MKRIVPVFLVLLLGLTSPAHGTQPLDTLQKPIDEVVGILKDPRYQDAAQKESQREKLWEIIRNVFNFSEISIRTLAINWKKFPPEQQKEFTDVFSEFLGNIYLKKIQGEFNNEKVVYLSQEILTDSKATVKTKILRENNIEIPVEYSMLLQNGVWKIYDVRIEGVSLVINYRTQFKEILLKESPAQLISRIKKKLEEQKSESGKK